MVREGDGVEEEGRILTRGGSLSSSFSKVDNNITRRASGREDNLLAEIGSGLQLQLQRGHDCSLRAGDPAIQA